MPRVIELAAEETYLRDLTPGPKRPARICLWTPLVRKNARMLPQSEMFRRRSCARGKRLSERLALRCLTQRGAPLEAEQEVRRCGSVEIRQDALLPDLPKLLIGSGGGICSPTLSISGASPDSKGSSSLEGLGIATLPALLMMRRQFRTAG